LRDVGYGEPYSSTVELVAGNVSDDIGWFLASSEQTYSQVLFVEEINTEEIAAGMDAPVKFAIGMLLQVMPKAALRAAKTANLSQESLIMQLESKGAVSQWRSLLAQGKALEAVMQELLADIDLEILPMGKEVQFHCPCSWDRMLGAIKIMGEEELKLMIADDRGAEAICHFCGEVYHANTEQLSQLLSELLTEKSITSIS
jgi:molecular chaperone Hsp33